MYSYTNFGMALIYAFFGTIFKSCTSNYTSCLIPNVIRSSNFSLVLISTQIVSFASLLSSNTIGTIPFTSFLTSIATKSKYIFLLISPCSHSKNDRNSRNELVARSNVFIIRSSYYRNSGLRFYFWWEKWIHMKCGGKILHLFPWFLFLGIQN